MKQIWKFGITADLLSIEMPKGAKPLCVQMQMNIPCLWAIVDPAAEKELVKVDIYGTGHDMPDNPGKYIGTFQVAEGRYVFHLFIPAL
jgi:hypothetical protein